MSSHNENITETYEILESLINNNLKEWEKIRKKEYPISIKWSPNIYNEMYILYRYNILPENRINNPTNPSLYAIRFKELAKKSFYFNNDRLYYIKKCETVRYDDGSFENKDNVILKKIPYIYEILPSTDHIHDIYGHISFRNLSKKLLSTNFFIDNIDIITEKYTKEIPECYSNFHSKQIIKKPKVIKDEGPHYRLLVDFTYLNQKY